MKDPEFQAALDKVDEATTKLGTGATAASAAIDGVSIRFDALKAKLSTSMTSDEVAAAKQQIDNDTTKLDTVVQALDAMATSLNGIGADATNPVPEPVPEPVVV